MRIKSVFSHSFEKYGKVLTGYDVTDLLKKLDDTTKKPDNAVIYEPGDAGLESLPIAKEFSDNAYGGMPIQVGYCNGNNTKLNCLEWHRGSELNIPSNDNGNSIYPGKIYAKCQFLDPVQSTDKIMAEDPKTLFVISSDFCHWGQRFGYTFYDKSKGQIWESTEFLDKKAMEIIGRMDPKEFNEYFIKYKK